MNRWARTHTVCMAALIMGAITINIGLAGCSGSRKDTEEGSYKSYYQPPYDLFRSPDGTRIAYLIDRTDIAGDHYTYYSTELRMINTDGTGDQPVYTVGPYISINQAEFKSLKFAWSHDSKKLAHLVSGSHLIIYDVATTTKTTLVASDQLQPPRRLQQIKSWIGNTITFTAGEPFYIDCHQQPCRQVIPTCQIQDDGTNLREISPTGSF